MIAMEFTRGLFCCVPRYTDMAMLEALACREALALAEDFRIKWKIWSHNCGDQGLINCFSVKNFYFSREDF
jgi:hypothetical protein